MNGGLSKVHSIHTYELKGFILVVSTVAQWHGESGRIRLEISRASQPEL